MVESLFGIVGNNGTFLTGTEHENIRLFTAHDFTPTGVKLTRTQLANEGHIAGSTLSSSNSITINGVTYTADATYDDALWAQSNLDKLYKTVALKANVVELNVQGDQASNLQSTASGLNADAATAMVGGTAANTFGSNAPSSATEFWVVDLKLEKGGTLKASPNAPQGGNTVGTTVIADVETYFEGTNFEVTSVSKAALDALHGATYTAGDAAAVTTAQNGSAGTNQDTVVDFVKYTRS